MERKCTIDRGVFSAESVYHYCEASVRKLTWVLACVSDICIDKRIGGSPLLILHLLQCGKAGRYRPKVSAPPAVDGLRAAPQRPIGESRSATGAPVHCISAIRSAGSTANCGKLRTDIFRKLLYNAAFRALDCFSWEMSTRCQQDAWAVKCRAQMARMFVAYKRMEK